MVNIDELKDSITEYTENEFIMILAEFFSEKVKQGSLRGYKLEVYLDRLLDKLILITGTGDVSDFIYYPESSDTDCPEGVLNEIKKWRKSQGLPLFKDSEQ